MPRAARAEAILAFHGCRRMAKSGEIIGDKAGAGTPSVAGARLRLPRSLGSIVAGLGAIAYLSWPTLSLGGEDATTLPAATLPVVSLSVEGAPRLPLGDDPASCGADDLPDAGLRAWRKDDGTLAIFANAENNFPYEGKDFTKLRKTCRSAYKSLHDADPSHYADQTWIAATWTDNGNDVMAIGHHEYHGDEHTGRCDIGVPQKCRYGALLALVSHDGGASFSKESPKPIAAVPARQQASQDRQTGFAQPSNIFGWGGAEYVFVRTSGGGSQAPGSCLLRTKDVFDPASWQMYTGNYEPALFDPYQDDAASRQSCKPIWTNGLVWSVLSAPAHDTLVALLSAVDLKTKGVYLATTTSHDAIHWSPLHRIDGLELNWGDKCPASPFLMYPSLVDPLSTSRNFDGLDHDNALLFFTRIEIKNCKFTRDRKLVAYSVKLKFSGS